jgi:spermidine/putrescine transport system permease protein
VTHNNAGVAIGKMGRTRRLYDLLGVPGNVALLALFVLPLIVIGVYSFGTVDIVGRPLLGSTLANYRQALQPYYQPAILRTLWLSVAMTAICLVFAYPVAYLAAMFGGRIVKIIIAALIVTWLVDYLVRIYAWITILDDSGILNSGLGKIGIGPYQFLPSTTAVLTGLVYGYFPLMVLPIYSSLLGFDKTLIDAGKDLYGTPFQTFWHVTLRYSLPGIIGGAVLTFFPALGDFATAQFLGGPNQSMIGNVISAQYFSQAGSVTFAAALTMFIVLALVVGVLITVALSRTALSSPARRSATSARLTGEAA